MIAGDIDASLLEGVVAAIQQSGAIAVGVVGDVTEPLSANRLVNTAVERFGRVDILVNVVGGSRTARIWEMGSAMEHAPLRHEGVVYAVAFADDPAVLWTATGRRGRAPVGGTARMWNHWTAEVVQEFGYGDGTPSSPTPASAPMAGVWP